MHFGLHSTPATLQHIIDVILSAVRWKYAFVYFDGMFIFSRTPEGNVKHTSMVLRLHKDANVTLELQKCAFFTNQIHCSDLIISLVLYKVASHTANITFEHKAATKVTELRFFLGLRNFFITYFPNFTRIPSNL